MAGAARTTNDRVKELGTPLAPPDPCGALRRDIAGLPTDFPGLLRDADTGFRGAVIATTIARLATLRPSERADCAADAISPWQYAADLIGAPDLIGRAMHWEEADPTPELLEQLLAVLSALEDAGWLEVAEDASRAVLALLPATPARHDVRAAHVWAARGRMLRVMGRFPEAREAYGRAQSSARRARDTWLDDRCELGFGVLAEQRGNIPEARAHYERVLARQCEGSPLARAARQGLVTAARAGGCYDEAFEHAWYAFQGAGRDPGQRLDALVQLGELCRRVGRTRAALRAADAALLLEPPPRYRIGILGTAMRAAEAEGLLSRAEEYADTIETLLPEARFDFYMAADARRDLAWWNLMRHETIGGRSEQTRRFASESLQIAERFGFHEISLELDDLLDRLKTARGWRTKAAALNRSSEEVVASVAALPLARERLLEMIR